MTTLTPPDHLGLRAGPTTSPKILTVTYGSWSLTALRKLAVGQKYLDSCPWYDEYEHLLCAPAGTYEVETYCDLGSDPFDRQLDRLLLVRPGWMPAPIVVAITAVFAELELGHDLPCGCVRTADHLPKDGHMLFHVKERRIYVESRTVHHCGPMPQYVSIWRPAV